MKCVLPITFWRNSNLLKNLNDCNDVMSMNKQMNKQTSVESYNEQYLLQICKNINKNLSKSCSKKYCIRKKYC